MGESVQDQLRMEGDSVIDEALLDGIYVSVIEYNSGYAVYLKAEPNTTHYKKVINFDSMIGNLRMNFDIIQKPIQSDPI